MTILKREDQPHQKPQIDLSGPDGNAYVVLGKCRGIAKQLNMDWDAIQKEATSGDYEHLLTVLNKYFGAYIDFIR